MRYPGGLGLLIPRRYQRHVNKILLGAMGALFVGALIVNFVSVGVRALH